MIFINISNYLINYYIIFLLKFIDSGLNVVRCIKKKWFYYLFRWSWEYW